MIRRFIVVWRKQQNPYGDGQAAHRIISGLKYHLDSPWTAESVVSLREGAFYAQPDPMDLHASTFTLSIAIAVIACYYLGNWIDARYGTGSIFSSLLVLWQLLVDFIICIAMFSASQEFKVTYTPRLSPDVREQPCSHLLLATM